MITLNDIPPGYVKIEPGELMPPKSYYRLHDKENNHKDIKNWYIYNRLEKGEKRTNHDHLNWFIKPAPAPKVKPVFKEITDIKIGDVFAYQVTGEAVIINVEKFTHDEDTRKYVILGCVNTLAPFTFTPQSKKDTISYLNSNKYIYITSIASQIEKTLKLARQIALEGK